MEVLIVVPPVLGICMKMLSFPKLDLKYPCNCFKEIKNPAVMQGF